MNIAVIGAGYVGLVQAAGLAELGHQVVGFDIDREKIDLLRQGKSPIFEPGLEPIITKNLKAGRLNFTTIADSAIKNAEVIFIAVGTPSRKDGSVDLAQIKQAAKVIGQVLAKSPVKKNRLVVNKSTVPIGTGDIVAEIIRRYRSGKIEVVSNPEFLREGQAVNDFLNPDRIVIGGGSRRARLTMRGLYQKIDAPLLFTDVKTAELIKYASNGFLAASISFINSLSWLAEAVGADVTKVAEGMKLDKRIGKNAFLTTGPGYGGSCFPKDVAGLIHIAKSNNVSLPIVEASGQINNEQKSRIVQKVVKALGSVKGKTIAVWGLSFKPNTDDIRESPALAVINKLVNLGANINAYDPVSELNAARLNLAINLSASPILALREADCLVVMTDWEEFKKINLDDIKKILKKPNIVDARNIFEPEAIKKAGIKYSGVGR